VDVGWASGLTLSGLIFLFSEAFTTRTIVLGVLLILWGGRLGLYLWYNRIRLGHIDKRYTNLSDGWKIAKPLGFFLNFQLQGLLIMLVATPWYFSGQATTQSLNILDYVGIVLAILALTGETLADNQLQQYKRVPTGALCTVGLWHYSRHPNYFFEWLVWCAFTLFGFAHSYGFIGLVSPLTLYLIMTQITAPMTEAGSLKSRGQAYLEYQKTTPMFFPRFNKLLHKE
jgi:steroid 5-alpha reductase family enzyme